MTVPRAITSGQGAADGLPRSGSKYCKAEGCTVNLHALNKPYCLKKRLCLQHLKADVLQCKGQGSQLWRFCQQCGKLQPLEMFQGNKRSCRASLNKRRLLDAAQKRRSSNKRAQQPQVQPQRRPSQDASERSTSLGCCCASVDHTAPAMQEDASYSSDVHGSSGLLEAQPEDGIAAAAPPAAMMTTTACNLQVSPCTGEPCWAPSGCTSASTVAAGDAAALLAEAWWQDQQREQQESSETGSEVEMMLVDVLSKTIADATIDAAVASHAGAQDTDPTEEQLEDMIAEELAAAGLRFTATGVVQLPVQQQQQQPVGDETFPGGQINIEAYAARPCCHLSAALPCVPPAQRTTAVPAQFPAASYAATSSVAELTARMHVLRHQVQQMRQMLDELQALQQMSLQAAAAPAVPLSNGGGSGISEGYAYYGC